MVEYNYDAWGRHTVSGSNIALGNKNPFRYRGYYYDTETELYYLQTRYYDPKLCRFINMDSLEYAEPERINGLNLFAYCGNNPVMFVDPSGHWFFTVLIICAVVGAAIGGTISGVEAAKNGGSALEVTAAVITGGAIGGTIGLGAGLIGGGGAALISAGAGMIGSGLGMAAIAGGGAVIAGGGAVILGAGAVVAGSAILAGSVVGGIALANVLFSRNPNNNFPSEGKPYSEVGIGNSVGYYDDKGHLKYRKDYSEHGGYNPHTHVYHWLFKAGKWIYNIARKVLPF